MSLEIPQIGPPTDFQCKDRCLDSQEAKTHRIQSSHFQHWSECGCFQVSLSFFFVILDTQISTLRSVSSWWRKGMLSEIQTTLGMAVPQWWITLMFPHALNPLKGGIEFYLVGTLIPFLNCFLNYWNEKLPTKHILAVPPIFSPFLPHPFLPCKVV